MNRDFADRNKILQGIYYAFTSRGISYTFCRLPHGPGSLRPTVGLAVPEPVSHIPKHRGAGADSSESDQSTVRRALFCCIYRAPSYRLESFGSNITCPLPNLF